MKISGKGLRRHTIPHLITPLVRDLNGIIPILATAICSLVPSCWLMGSLRSLKRFGTFASLEGRGPLKREYPNMCRADQP